MIHLFLERSVIKSDNVVFFYFILKRLLAFKLLTK